MLFTSCLKFRRKNVSNIDVSFSYNLDNTWADNTSASPEGKLGYLMALHMLGYSFAQIVDRIEEKFSAHTWPENFFSKEEAVEIAVLTNGDYAQYAGRTSLCVLSYTPRLLRKNFRVVYGRRLIRVQNRNTCGCSNAATNNGDNLLRGRAFPGTYPQLAGNRSAFRSRW